MRMLPLRSSKFRVSLFHEYLPPYRDTPPIFHEHTDEFALITKGRVALYLDGHRFLLKRGDMLTIPAGVEHRFRTGRVGVEALSLFAPPIEPDSPDVHPGKGSAVSRDDLKPRA